MWGGGRVEDRSGAHPRCCMGGGGAGRRWGAPDDRMGQLRKGWFWPSPRGASRVASCISLCSVTCHPPIRAAPPLRLLPIGRAAPQGRHAPDPTHCREEVVPALLYASGLGWVGFDPRDRYVWRPLELRGGLRGAATEILGGLLHFRQRPQLGHPLARCGGGRRTRIRGEGRAVAPGRASRKTAPTTTVIVTGRGRHRVLGAMRGARELLQRPWGRSIASGPVETRVSRPLIWLVATGVRCGGRRSWFRTG
jgi:hypothetical protein